MRLGNEVILEGAGATITASTRGPGGLLEYYIPGEGRLHVALEPFEKAIEGTADGSLLHFHEAGIEYQIFSRQAITGGDQPHRIWVRLDATFRPSAEGGDDSKPWLSALRLKSH